MAGILLNILHVQLMNNFVNYGNRRAISGKSKNSAVENYL
jgi:hypothetical protein